MNRAFQPTILNLSDPVAEEDLARRVARFLYSHQPALWRRIDVAADGDTVTVQGTVCSFYDRQLAIACIRRVAGVRHVVDLLTVAESPDRIRKPHELQKVLI